MELTEHITQFLCDAHGQENRHTRADADNFDMRDFMQPRQNLFEDFWSQYQWVAAGKQDVAHLWRALEILDLHLEFFARKRGTWVSDDARARAISAIRGTLSGYQHEDSVRIPVNQPRHGRVAVFRERIFHHGCERYHLCIGWDHLLSYWIFRVVWINQRDKVRRNIHAK